MPSLKQRLESLEQSSAADGQMSHDEWVVHWMDKPINPRDAAKPAMTDEEFDAVFARMQHKWRRHHGKT